MGPAIASENLRATAFMVAAMAAFAIEDFFIKAASRALPVGQIVFLLAIGGAVIFAGLCVQRRVPLWSRSFFDRLVVVRNLAEVLATLCFVTALALVPLSLVAAILQATPLLVTVGAAVWLREHVGCRRWAAVLIGLVGVLIILRPGFEGFRPATLLAVIASAGLAARDLASRRIPSTIDSGQLAFWAYVSVAPAGLALSAVYGGVASGTAASWVALALALVIGSVAYACLIAATRIGDVSAVIPYRYSRLVFALVLGVALLGERPDGLTLLGAGIVVSSGLYAWLRERRRAREQRSPPTR
ncbi:MAG: DMT family transporter [Pseudomonadota bacterium]